jgi:cellulose synthase/poly-beta-1,6-N-acetylglucosamine synthase-like glycosyltransferase
MNLFLTGLHYLLYAVGIFLLLNCVYLLFFSLIGHRRRELVPLANAKGSLLRRICVLIPAYREDAVIIDTTRRAVAHSYNGVAQVVVVADGLQPQTLNILRELGAGVVEVNFERSTKGKALLHALSILPPTAYDIAVVLDADNIMGTGCLNSINDAFGAGYRVVQTHRTAKNQGTAFSFLDACNEEINNHIYRKGPAALGMSAALIGSGMAFEYSYLRELLTGIGETVGEDKELDFRIARDANKIAYLDRVYTYDEKIDNAQVFTQQRTRWLASQIEFLKKYALEGVRQLVKFGNVEFFHKALQTLLVPRTLLMGVLGVFFLLSLVLPVGPPVAFWAGLLLLLGAALFIALPGRLYSWQLVHALLRLPYAIWCMCLALFRIRRTKTSFLATPHRVHDTIAQH